MKKLKFEDMKLSKEIKKAISDMGFEEATPIQSQAIPYIVDGFDVIGQSQTGTGKTVAFGAPLIEMTEADNNSPQSLVLCPTRELAVQVAEEIKKLSKYNKRIHILPVYGGQSINRQIKSLKKGVQIVIGTPGRVMDHMRRGTLKIDNIKRIVLDEADEMFDMGFRDDIQFIMSSMPKNRQSIFFSATMPKKIVQFAQKFQKNPKIIKVVHKQLTVPLIEQYYFELKEKMKTEVLCRLIDIYNPKLSLVFCNTKKRVDELVTKLQTRGYSADGLHGDMRQNQRDKVMDKFRRADIDILVATDIAARGIDVDDIDIVFNYDIPQDEEYYVHRIGRTARSGRSGKAFSFAVGRDMYKLRDIQRYAKIKITRQDLPTLNDVEEKQMDVLFKNIKRAIKNKELPKYEKMIGILLEQDYDLLDISSALLKLYMGKNTKHRHEEIKIKDIKNISRKSRMTKLFINIGKKQNVSSRHIVGAIVEKTSVPKKSIGKISVLKKYTFVEVPKENAKEVVSALKNSKIKGKKINIEISNSKK